MGFDELKSEALKLGAQHRAALARELLASLQGLSDAEVEQLWLEEAARRDAELARESAHTPSAPDVLARARARLR